VNPPTVTAITSTGSCLVHKVTTTSLYARDRGFYVVVLSSSLGVAAGQKLYLTFPPEFSSFNGQSLEVSQSLEGVTNTSVSIAPVDGTRLEVSMLISVVAGTRFQVAIQSLPNPPSPGQV
jgi:hypothetical protein